MTKFLKIMVPVLLLALFYKADAQVVGSLGDVQVDEREFYTMTKQMGQFMHRFNYEEDPSGKRLYPGDKDYRNASKRRESVPLLFDLENPRTNGTLRDMFIEDITKKNQYMEFLGGNWFSEISAKYICNGKDRKKMFSCGIKRDNNPILV